MFVFLLRLSATILNEVMRKKDFDFLTSSGLDLRSRSLKM